MEESDDEISVVSSCLVCGTEFPERNCSFPVPPTKTPLLGCNSARGKGLLYGLQCATLDVKEVEDIVTVVSAKFGPVDRWSVSFCPSHLKVVQRAGEVEELILGLKKELRHLKASLRKDIFCGQRETKGNPVSQFLRNRMVSGINNTLEIRVKKEKPEPSPVSASATSVVTGTETFRENGSVRDKEDAERTTHIPVPTNVERCSSFECNMEITRDTGNLTSSTSAPQPMNEEETTDPIVNKGTNEDQESRHRASSNLRSVEPKKDGSRSRRTKLRKEKLKSSSKTETVCDICFKRYSTPKGLRRHMTRVHDNGAYKCSLCQTAFSSKKGLVEHQRNHHLKSLRFQCPLCDKTNQNKSSHLYHLKKMHRTTEHDETFSDGSPQKRNMPNSPLACKSKFSTASPFKQPLLVSPTDNVQAHLQNMVKEPAIFECFQCHQSFSTAKQINKHKRHCDYAIF